MVQSTIPEFKIIKIDDSEEEAFVTMQNLVDFSGNKYESVRDLIVKHKSDVEELGPKLPTDLRGRADLKSARFNQEQTAFIMTLMANTDPILLFKKTMTKEFFVYRNYIKQLRGELQELTLKQKDLLTSKSKTIQTLASTDKDYKKIIKKEEVYISAGGLASGQKFNGREFKDLMVNLGLVIKRPLLQFYYEVTIKGLKSGLITTNGKVKTPYYHKEKCLDLMTQNLSGGKDTDEE